MSLAATLVLKLQFWFMISLLAKHRARLNMQRQQRQRERSAITKTKNAFNCAHRQLHCHPSQGPSPPASRPLRQAAVAEPRACDSQTQDNADTSYPKRVTTPRDATRMYSISLASLCPTTKTRLETHLPSIPIEYGFLSADRAAARASVPRPDVSHL
jgi:hypothetical protein